MANEAETKLLRSASELRFNSHGLIPAIIQDAGSGQVLMLAYMNEGSFNKTLATGLTWFYSRSREVLWQKGESSGHVQNVREIFYDCDLDTLLIRVDQTGVACHTGKPTCFYRSFDLGGSFGSEEADSDESETSSEAHSSAPGIAFDLAALYAVIKERKKTMPEGSYTSKLFTEGRSAITAKIEEESEEVVDAAFNKAKPDVIWEAADLIYHLFVLLVNEGIEMDEVVEELAGRHHPSK